MGHDYSILPRGYHFAYVSDFVNTYCTIDEDEDQDAGYTAMNVADMATGKHLFRIDKSSGSGDYRTFPSCVFQFPFIDDEFYNAIAPFCTTEEMVAKGQEPTWGNIFDTWHALEDVMEIQFIVRDMGEGNNPEYDTNSPYRYDFVGWLPTDDSFDLQEELENMDIET